MRRVIIESPYKAERAIDVQRNIQYAKAAMRDCIRRGECPFASHLLYTQEGILDDSNALERDLGIHIGLIWALAADATVVYTDLGISEGMQRGIEAARAENRPVEIRSIPDWAL